jgi:hypothetical protein
MGGVMYIGTSNTLQLTACNLTNNIAGASGGALAWEDTNNVETAETRFWLIKLMLAEQYLDQEEPCPLQVIQQVSFSVTQQKQEEL